MSSGTIETLATSGLHALSATGLGQALDMVFPQVPADGSLRNEAKEALLVAAQFSAGILAARSMLEILLPNSPNYRSPIGDGLFVFFFYMNQPRMRARLDALVNVVVRKAMAVPRALEEEVVGAKHQPQHRR